MYRTLRPLLFRLDAEAAHTATLALARAAQRPLGPLLRRAFAANEPRLAQTVFGRRIDSPVGLAAGLDKNARLVPTWDALGFGWAEVGSATARASTGNPRPRLWRLPEVGALVNRMGLGNDGAEAIAARLARIAAAPPRMAVGVNVAKTHDPEILGEAALDDFRASFSAVAPHAAWVTLNVSCPNTREGTTFEAPEALDGLLAAILEVRARVAPAVPLLVKLAPPPAGDGPLSGVYDEIVAVCQSRGVDGFVAGNTASDRVGVPAAVAARAGAGGLSGAPLAARSRRLVRHLYRATNGAVPIVGTGGIASAEDAYASIRAGATLVGLYTGLVYQGPGLVRAIKRGLTTTLDRDGFASIGDAVGADA